MLRPNCKDCKYFESIFMDDNMGECRKNPPTPILMAVAKKSYDSNELIANKLVGEFPPVGKLGWCGQFEESEKSKQ